jgi:hypothetical protein
MSRWALWATVLAILNWAWISQRAAASPIQTDSLEKQASNHKLDRLSGLFLTSKTPDAIPVPVKSIFRKAEPKTYSIRPKPELRFIDFRFARAGSLFQPGGNIDLARNIYEKDNKGYWTHIYLKPKANQRLARARAQQKTDIVLLINGLGKGRVVPVDLKLGHWAIANIKHGGPGGYLTVTINTHIMIALNKSGQVPDPYSQDKDRQEVEYSLKDYIYQYFWQMGGNGIGGAISSEDFSRTGSLGAVLYADFVDSGKAEHALRHQWPNLGFSKMAESFAMNLPPSMQASVFQYVKERTFRRGLVCEDMEFAFWALNNNPESKKYEKMLLTDDDPMIVATGFSVASAESTEEYRSDIVKSVNACFVEQQIPSESTRLFEKIATEKMTECVAALAQYLMQTTSPRAVAPGIDTLSRLDAYDSLGDVIVQRPVANERQLRRALRSLRWKGKDDRYAQQKAAVLVRLSTAALAGQWTHELAAHKRLVSSVLSLIGANSRSGPSKAQGTQTCYQTLRSTLYLWIGKPGGEDVLASLASSAPMPNEVPIFVTGLANPDLHTAAQCVKALSRLEANHAMPALLAVFDRKDALDDLHPQLRSETQGARRAMAFAPPEQDSIAYWADQALFHLAGAQTNEVESVPPYTDRAVLLKRRAYWRSWLRANHSENH